MLKNKTNQNICLITHVLKQIYELDPDTVLFLKNLFCLGKSVPNATKMKLNALLV